jgi:hypothetical protein
MRKIMNWIKTYVIAGLVIGFLALLPISSIGIAGEVIATLNINPSPTVKPGASLNFSATASYMDPAFVCVKEVGTNWKTEQQKVNYPAPGQSGTVSFTKSYPIPADAKSGKSFCFELYRVNFKIPGKDILISKKTCVTVKIVPRVSEQEGPIKGIQSIPPKSSQ